MWDLWVYNDEWGNLWCVRGNKIGGRIDKLREDN